MSCVQVTPASTQRNLLTLPQELRDDIYLVVLQTPSEPPQSPENTGPRVAGFGSEPERGKGVFYPTNIYPRYACQNLQACNHQMNTEVREILDRHDTSERGLDFKLDLTIKDCQIWPTWTLFPGPITHIRNLEVEMRIFDGRHGHQGSQFGGDGGPGPIFRPLFHLLSGFFHHGPQFVYKGPFDRQLHVDTMVLSMRHRTVSSVWRLLRMIASHGTLSGRVSKLKLNTDEGVKEFPIPDKELAQETLQYWDDYGYHWGVETSSDWDSIV